MLKDKIFRYERKFFITEINSKDVDAIVKLHPAIFSEIFHERSVNNIYFDTPELNNYFDNIDGNMYRVKSRIRWYGRTFGVIEKPVLELKIKNGLLGRKEAYSLDTFKLDGHFNMQKIVQIIQNTNIPEFIAIGIKSSQPTLLNKYDRRYFLSADKRYRITIDTNQIFYRIGSQNNFFLNKIKNDLNVILELKYNINFDEDANHITEHFPFRLTKSSKYVTGIEKIYV